MNKVVTYVTNIEEFMVELEEMFPTYVITDEETGKKTSKIFTTPVVKNENGSLVLSMLSNEELALVDTMTTIESLGTYDQMFSNPEAEAKYNSVYPYNVPLTYEDEDGNVVEYMRPKKIGEFA